MFHILGIKRIPYLLHDFDNGTKKYSILIEALQGTYGALLAVQERLVKNKLYVTTTCRTAHTKPEYLFIRDLQATTNHVPYMTLCHLVIAYVVPLHFLLFQGRQHIGYFLFPVC